MKVTVSIFLTSLFYFNHIIVLLNRYSLQQKQSSGHVKVSDIEAMWEQGRMFIRQLIESVWSDINGTVQKKYFSGLPPSKEADQYTAEGKVLLHVTYCLCDTDEILFMTV